MSNLALLPTAAQPILRQSGQRAHHALVLAVKPVVSGSDHGERGLMLHEFLQQIGPTATLQFGMLVAAGHSPELFVLLRGADCRANSAEMAASAYHAGRARDSLMMLLPELGLLPSESLSEQAQQLLSARFDVRRGAVALEHPPTPGWAQACEQLVRDVLAQTGRSVAVWFGVSLRACTSWELSAQRLQPSWLWQMAFSARQRETLRRRKDILAQWLQGHRHAYARCGIIFDATDVGAAAARIISGRLGCALGADDGVQPLGQVGRLRGFAAARAMTVTEHLPQLLPGA